MCLGVFCLNDFNVDNKNTLFASSKQTNELCALKHHELLRSDVQMYIFVMNNIYIRNKIQNIVLFQYNCVMILSCTYFL